MEELDLNKIFDISAFQKDKEGTLYIGTFANDKNVASLMSSLGIEHTKLKYPHLAVQYSMAKDSPALETSIGKEVWKFLSKKTENQNPVENVGWQLSPHMV